NERNKLQDYLAKHSVQTLIHYPIPIHKQLAYNNLNTYSYPITEKLHDEILSLPIGSFLSIEDADYIVSLINEFE
ncbi:DegT/DnrJ/EryC1/StrS family aminotransferase, partial [Escherichia coli]|nr:DegT/DnrJ/EryC1/StrS family aminotransferase [Escherichia coli]